MVGMALTLAVLAVPEVRSAAAKPKSEGGTSTRGMKEECRPERAQRFLIRSSFVRAGMVTGREHQRALRYRVKNYGHVEGLGYEKYNSESADKFAVQTRFMGLPLRVHGKIVPPLRCVERHIKKTCKKKGSRYVPQAVGGFRQGNTYRGGEVSNHLFGIAIDIDPEKNPCCGCVDPWPNHPLCKADARSIYDKTSLPKCWVSAFERYGFYWLGKDTLEDTMHFEFLGDPD